MCEPKDILIRLEEYNNNQKFLEDNKENVISNLSKISGLEMSIIEKFYYDSFLLRDFLINTKDIEDNNKLFTILLKYFIESLVLNENLSLEINNLRALLLKKFNIAEKE